MAAYYGLFVTLHLLAAITFVGAVFFEVLVIEPLQKKLPLAGAEIAAAIPGHVRSFMPSVVAVLFLSGAAMFWIQFSNRPDFFTSKFGVLLTIKLTLAFAVLGIFVLSLRAMKTGRMDLCRFRRTHQIVAVLMLAIVLLAKGMFYL